jgi:hypothetical protein
LAVGIDRDLERSRLRQKPFWQFHGELDGRSRVPFPDDQRFLRRGILDRQLDDDSVALFAERCGELESRFARARGFRLHVNRDPTPRRDEH